MTQKAWMNLVALVLAGVVMAAWRLWCRHVDGLRARAMGLIAKELGLAFSPCDPLASLDDGRKSGLLARFFGSGPRGIPMRFGRFGALTGALEASNVIYGNHRERRVTAFDAKRLNAGNLGEKGREISVAVIGWDGDFPRLVIRPRSGLDSMAAVAGLDDLRLESRWFSERFRIICTDRRLASAVINPRAMEFLLAHQGWSIEVNGSGAIIWNDQPWLPGEFVEAIKVLSEFLDLIPQFVWKEYLTECSDRPQMHTDGHR